jgi:single-strand DNA-binding protein
MRVIVNGRLRQRSYETREGEKRTVYEIEVDEVGPSLRNASAKVSRSTRSGGGGGFGGGQSGQPGQPGQPGQAGQAGPGGYGGGAGGRASDDPWAADPADSGFSDEPPF